MYGVVVQSEQELNECLGIRREVFIIEQHVPEELEVDESDHLASSVMHVLVYDEAHHPVGTARLNEHVRMEKIIISSL